MSDRPDPIPAWLIRSLVITGMAMIAVAAGLLVAFAIITAVGAS